MSHLIVVVTMTTRKNAKLKGLQVEGRDGHHPVEGLEGILSG